MDHDFILLDRSKSMDEGSKWPEALAAINTYVKKLAEDKVDTGVTLAVFDKNHGVFDYHVVRERIIPSTWHPVTNLDAQPRGNTPLNEAILRMVADAEKGNYNKVAIIIVTDGEENASSGGSRQETTAQAKAALSRCRERGWVVLFFGNDYENSKQAADLGSDRGAAVAVASGFMGEAATMTAVKRGLYGSGASATMDFSDEEKKRVSKS